MVNTGNGKAQTATPISSEIATPAGLADEDGNIDFTTLPVTIEVTSTGKSYSYPNTNAYPHAVMIPVDWRWPTERTIITEAYQVHLMLTRKPSMETKGKDQWW